MSFIDLARKRYSVRNYLERPVEREKLLKVVEAGRIAPSAVNNQPWHFIVVDDEETKEQLAGAYPRQWFRKAPTVILVCGDHKQSWKRGDGKDHCDVDTAIAATHMTLAAADMGLGTCWVCAFDSQKCHSLFNLPRSIEVIALLPIGYPAEEGNADRHNTARKKIEDIMSWNSFKE